VDQALSRGEIDRSLPFVRREAVRVLKSSYASQDAAFAGVQRDLLQFYRVNAPAVLSARRAQVDGAIRAVQRLYGRNVFPAMKVSWGTYANNLGHMDFPGCFRCHDETHTSQDGSTIAQDCELCHTQEELPPPTARALN
jgi:hypothetical protein